MSVAHFLTFGNIHMEEKNVLESAFEWICECGAFEQLRKQCEQYTKDFTVSLAPRLHPESSSLKSGMVNKFGLYCKLKLTYCVIFGINK